MFDDMFDTAEEILTGVKEGAVLSSWDRLPKNCADLLPMPEKERKQGYPIGLKNQGATCYLNGFLQILFHTPQLRKLILDLPLCKEDIDTKSDFVGPNQHRFLLGFQRLFSEMSLRDVNAVGTDYLNKAFGWEGKEHVEQQDMSEAMKIIFDTMERALYETPFEMSMKNLMKGVSSRYKNCRNCTVTEERLEDFYDFLVQVEGMQSLDEALMNSLKAQAMEGDNRIFCETCQSKQDMWLGTKFKSLPEILIFSLNRFTFDYETFTRVKLNSYFQFNLEQNLTHLIDEGKEEEFELYGVIVHRGTAQGGHYFCYIRDLLQESNWSASIDKAHEEEKKREESKGPGSELTEEQRKKREELEKEDKVHQLVPPQNPSLLENWYELNDSVVTAIDAQKITSKYEGSESAYVLFYKRKGSKMSKEDIKVPEYFRKQIQTENDAIIKERTDYEHEKEQIVLKIEGNDQKLSIKTPISKLLEQFCPEGFSLVMEATHNGLPYYPLEFNRSDKQLSEEDTIEKYDVYHESIWKLFLMEDEDYLTNVRPAVGKDRLPFEANILQNGTTKKVVLFQDLSLADLRKRIESEFDLKYEQQIIQLVTPYKELFVTDDLSNDELLLTKLGFVHECQIILKKLEPKASDQNQSQGEGQNREEELDKDLLCFVVERDDQMGIKRLYFSKFERLRALLHFILKSEGLSENDKRRLRNLNGNRLYYIDHYEKQLLDLDFTEEIIKLRLEKGEIPVKGDICVKVKLQSKWQKVPQDTQIERVFDPNTTIAALKEDMCREAELDPEVHRVYLTDWMYEPVRSLTKQTQSIFDSHFGREETVCLRDTESPIGSELIHFEVFLTETGSPDSVSQDSFHAKTEMHKTVFDFKQKLLKQEFFKGKNLNPKNLRVRELKRDYMFGNIWRSHEKQMKDVPINNNKIVVQVMGHEEELKDDQIVLALKRRNHENREYEGHEELVFEAGKVPKVEDLYKAVKARLSLQQQFDLLLIKYFNYNFEWIQVSERQLEKFANSKKGGSKGPKKQKDKNQKQQRQEKEKESGTAQTESPEDSQNQKGSSDQKQQGGTDLKNEEAKRVVETKSQVPEDTKKQNEQPNKKKKQPKQAPIVNKEEHLNLRKPPTLLKDGDWIGWTRKSVVDESKDDLQTDEDLSLRVIKKNNKNMNVVRRNQGGGFKMNVGF